MSEPRLVGFPQRGFRTAGAHRTEDRFCRIWRAQHQDRHDSLGLLLASEERLIRGWEKLRSDHPTAPDVGSQSKLFSTWSRENAAVVRPYVDKYDERRKTEPEALDQALRIRRSPTTFGLLRNLQDLWLMVNESAGSVAGLLQGARALGDRDLERDLSEVENRNKRQLAWLLDRIRQTAPQTLTVPS